MQGRITQHLGQCLSIVGTAITTAFQGGTAFATEGLSELEVIVSVTFDAATTITTLDLQLQISDDLTNWDAIASIKMSNANVGATQTISASAGNTVRDRIQVNQQANQPQFRLGKYARLAAKSTGASKSGDSVVAQMNIGD